MIYFFTMETFFSFISKLLMFPWNQSSYCNYLLTKYPNIIIIKIILFNLFNNIKYHLWHPLYGCLFSILRIFTIYHILNFTYLPQESKLFKKGLHKYISILRSLFFLIILYQYLITSSHLWIINNSYFLH